MYEVRNRKMEGPSNHFKAGMARFETTMGESLLQFKLMPSRAKVCVFLSAILSLFLYLYLASWIFQSDSDTPHESLLDTSKCPACFGSTACGLFYYDQITMSGTSKFRILDKINPKNVHFAQLAHNRADVVLKKMASDGELSRLDDQICRDAMRPEGCDVARVIPRTNQAIPFSTKPLTPDALKDTGAFMFMCPSYRLLDTMWTHFQEYKKKNQVFMSDKMQVLYSAMVNPEPLMLQTFPKSEGWPFPQYIGACGRVIVEDHAGEMLSKFYSSDFSVRAALAYELMKIADTLTSKLNYALYLTDVSYENFAVDRSGKVTVVDLEHIIVVDKIALRARAAAEWDQPHEAAFDDCGGRNCLSFTQELLCNRETSDHNYYAICRGLLSRYANEPGMPGGLLHDMPERALDQWDLEYLLNECANPSHPSGRFTVKTKLMQALMALKDEPLDRPPPVLKGRKSEGRL